MRLKMIGRKMALMWKRKSRIAPILCIITVFYIIMQSLLNRSTRHGALYSTYGKQGLTQDKEIRHAAAKCELEILSHSYPERCKTTPLLLVLISSSPNHFTQRNMLRSHFDNNSNSTAYGIGPLWRIVFLIAKTNNWHLEKRVEQEAEVFRDVIHSRFREMKATRSYKTLIGFSWVFCQCTSKYVIKIEENSFVNLRILVNSLLTNQTGAVGKTGVYTGVSSWMKIPNAEIKVEDKISNGKSWEPGYHSMPFIVGSAYLLSMDVLHKMVPLLLRYPAFSTVDAYIAFLVQQTGVRAVNSEKFHMQINSNLLSICDYREIYVGVETIATDQEKMIEESRRSETECRPVITMLPRSNSSISRE